MTQGESMPFLGIFLFTLQDHRSAIVDEGRGNKLLPFPYISNLESQTMFTCDLVFASYK